MTGNQQDGGELRFKSRLEEDGRRLYPNVQNGMPRDRVRCGESVSLALKVCLNQILMRMTLYDIEKRDRESRADRPGDNGLGFEAFRHVLQGDKCNSGKSATLTFCLPGL